MGKLIKLSEHMIPRPALDKIDEEIVKCANDLKMFGRCSMIDGKRVDPFDVYINEGERE